MKLSRKWWVTVPLAGMLATGLCSVPSGATPSTATTTVLAMSTVKPMHLFAKGRTTSGKSWATVLASYGLTDAYVVENDFQPGQTSGWHSHPGPSLVFVVSGTVINYVSTRPHCAGKTYTAGETFVDAGGLDVHMISNTGTEPAETIAVQFIPNGQERRIDEPEPSNCHV
jgi:quercetin dioxygenase-like cupin family protein